jgi:hypothetical protein
MAPYVFRSLDSYCMLDVSRYPTGADANEENIPILDRASGSVLIAKLRQACSSHLCLDICDIPNIRIDRNYSICRTSETGPSAQDLGTYESLDDVFRIADARFYWALRIRSLLLRQDSMVDISVGTIFNGGNVHLTNTQFLAWIRRWSYGDFPASAPACTSIYGCALGHFLYRVS